MNQLPQLIVFLEVDAKEIIDLIRDVEPICNFHYPYEYHITIGWFVDDNPETLHKWGTRTVNYVKEQLLKLDCKLSIEKDSLFQVVINASGRQPFSRGRGFYLQPTEQTSQHLVKIHNELASYLQKNQIHTSELLSNYHPHVSLTTPTTLEMINRQQEKIILQTINDKIAAQNEELPEGVFLKRLAIRAILKYIDEHGIERKEIWH